MTGTTWSSGASGNSTISPQTGESPPTYPARVAVESDHPGAAAHLKVQVQVWKQTVQQVGIKPE